MGGKKVGTSAHPITDFDLPMERGHGNRPAERTPRGTGVFAPGTSRQTRSNRNPLNGVASSGSGTVSGAPAAPGAPTGRALPY